MSIISGEFWITEDGNSTYADGDVGDANHQSVAFEAALGISLDSEESGQPELIPMDKFDDEAAEWLIENGASKEAVEYLKDGSDPRDYALEHMGWIRVKGDNFQMWDFNDDALDRIKNFDEWENAEDPEGLEDSEDTINIEQYKDNRMWTVSLKELFKAKSAEGLKRYKDGIGKWRNPGSAKQDNPQRDNMIVKKIYEGRYDIWVNRHYVGFAKVADGKLTEWPKYFTAAQKVELLRKILSKEKSENPGEEHGPDTPWSYFGIDTTKAQADAWRRKAESGTCPFCRKSLARSSFGSTKKHLVACTKKLRRNE